MSKITYGTGNNERVTDFSFRFAPFEMTGILRGKRVLGGSGEAAASQHPSCHSSGSHFDQWEKSLYYRLLFSCSHESFMSAAGGFHPAPAFGGYPPTLGGIPPAFGGYPPNSWGIPPAFGGFPPTLGGFPQRLGDSPQLLGDSPSVWGNPPNSWGIPPAFGGYPPTLGGIPQAFGGWLPTLGG